MWKVEGLEVQKVCMVGETWRRWPYEHANGEYAWDMAYGCMSL